VAGTCEYGKEPSGSIKCGEFLGYLRQLASFSRRTLLHGVSTVRCGFATAVNGWNCRTQRIESGTQSIATIILEREIS
jgi:hypothetical protein